MPGIRVDRFLASTAIVFLLCAAGGGAFADPPTAASVNAALAAPVSPLRRLRRDPTPQRSPQLHRMLHPPRQIPPQRQNQTTPPAQALLPRPRRRRLQRPLVPARPLHRQRPRPQHREIRLRPSPSTATVGTPATPETAAAPAAAPPGPDAAIADQLRDLANGKFDHMIGNKKDRTQIDAFYSGRNYKPLWITDGKANSARQRGDRLSRPCRCRRTVSSRLSGAELCRALQHRPISPMPRSN